MQESLIDRTVRTTVWQRSALGLLSALATSPAWGQSTPASNNNASAEAVVVTGTRSAVKASKSLSPIAIFTSADLKRTGQTNLKNAIVALDPSASNTPGYPGQLGFTTKTMSLRGLGANETLVLVNGKRRHTMASVFYGGAMQGQSPVDLDMIPMSAVDHIEILKDGAAAQYGSDAIAGVVNIILKSADHGGNVDLGYNQYGWSVGPLGDYGRGGALNYNQGFRIGRGGFLNLTAEFVGNQSTNYAGYVPRTQGGSPVLLYPLLPNGQPDPRENGNRYRQISGSPESERQSIAYNLEIPLNTSVKFYSYATYSHRTSFVAAWYRPSNSQQNIMSVYPDGYLPTDTTEDNDFQFTSGVRGKDFFGWQWDASVNYGRDDSSIGIKNTINNSLGPTSPHDFHLQSLTNGELTADVDLRRSVRTGLFHAPLQVAAGVEYRYQHYEVGAGEWAAWADGGYINPASSVFPQPTAALPFASGLGATSPSQAGSHARMNGAFYLDLTQKVTDTVTVGLSGRDEQYSDFGNALSGKASLRYQVTPWLALRGSASNGFHAPTLQQEYFQSTALYYTILPSTNQLVQSYTNYASVNNPGARALGATPLKPETSHNFSVGFVLTPLRRFDLSLDAYRIDVFNQIVPISVSGAGVAGAQVLQILHDAGVVPNDGRYYGYTYERNAAHVRAMGLDLQAHYLTPLGRAGSVAWTVMMNQQQHQIMRVNPLNVNLGAGVNALYRSQIGNITAIYPRNTLRLSATWMKDGWSTTVRVSRYSKTQLWSDRGAAYDQTVEPAWLVDVDLSYTFSNRIRLSAGGNNIFNHRPQTLSPLAQGAQSLLQVNPNYSYASAYGLEGGYFYGRIGYSW
ncbi:TonB-dependent outermembrane receptor [Ameyamaea chiangmaiensis NBRC 103196]|uniref:TonB-dependent receptor n=1 Tax=Ameyamaea chiangmaiensis TaxID=442969 RepID=A0A850PB71_9PROT|nr:TonB-dependent receptor [Ameyamaea chiangmaiensis]MBS4074931.1 TonB-dependent receptor [Ameyamaea chiangmaiensis]NVN41324.1 TonB-dependent receptor [Ameyamaea chiangmaiensis]GBQ63241.1 TonB-dependent outermembrane receptor [Ameyamaea chiangmaiensis NBRC 103196]